MKKKWWLIVIAAVLLVAVLAAALWDTLMVWVAPKVVLSAAIPEWISGLEARFQASPGMLVLDTVDPDGKYTAQMELETSNELLGKIVYDMNVQLQSAPKAVMAEGNVSYSGKTADLALYMDKDCAAVSSQALLQGNFYGITFETFSSDIRSDPLLAYVIGESTIREWEESISALQETLSREHKLPNLSGVDPQTVLYGALALDAQVSRETRNSGMKCYKISFSATGAQIADAIRQYLPDADPELLEMLEPLTDDPESLTTVSFLLSDGKLIGLSLEASANGETLAAALDSGMDPETDDLILRYESNGTDGAEAAEIQITTDRTESVYAEKIAVLTRRGEEKDRTVLDYSWDLQTGELVLDLTQGGGDTQLVLNLEKAENNEGFCVTTDQFETLIGLLNGEEKAGSSKCTMTVRRGAEVTVPEYKNFDKWSLEDLWILVSGVGGLFGLQLS